MAVPHNQGQVSALGCRRIEASTHSDTGRRREPQCIAEPCRRNSGARKARCWCKRARRTEQIHRCRPNHRRCRRGRRNRTRRPSRPNRWCRPGRLCLTYRQHRPSRWCRRARRRLRNQKRPQIRTRPLHHRAADKQRRDSRRRSMRRCPAHNRHTTPDLPRSRPCRRRRSVHPRSLPPHRCRHGRQSPSSRRLRRHSLHRHRPSRAWPSSRTLRPPPTKEEQRPNACLRVPGQHHACHRVCDAGVSWA